MESSSSPEPSLTQRQVDVDHRLYVPFPDGWTAQIKSDGVREYCYFKSPGHDWYHLILPGELYLQYGDQRYCLNCALRQRHATEDRQYWQRGPRKRPDPIH